MPRRTYNSFVIPICESSDVVGRRALQLDRVGNANAKIMEGFDLDEGCQEFLFNVKQEEKRVILHLRPSEYANESEKYIGAIHE